MTEAIRCSCQQLNDPWRRYCGGCGNALGTSCRCGFPNAENDRYCGGCGVTVTRPAVQLPTFLRRPPPTVQQPFDLSEDMRTRRIEMPSAASAFEPSAHRTEVLSDAGALDTGTQRMEMVPDASAPVLDTSTQRIEMLCDAVALDPNT